MCLEPPYLRQDLRRTLKTLLVGTCVVATWAPVLNNTSHWTTLQLSDGTVKLVQSPSVRLVLPIRFDLGKHVGSVTFRPPRLPNIEHVEDRLVCGASDLQ